MKQVSIEKLENLLKQVSEEMINLYKEGYRVDVSLPFSKDDGCSISVYKPNIIVRGHTGVYGTINNQHQEGYQASHQIGVFPLPIEKKQNEDL